MQHLGKGGNNVEHHITALEARIHSMIKYQIDLLLTLRSYMIVLGH